MHLSRRYFSSVSDGGNRDVCMGNGCRGRFYWVLPFLLCRSFFASAITGMNIVVAIIANGIGQTTTKDGLMTILSFKRKLCFSLLSLSSATTLASTAPLADILPPTGQDRYLIRFSDTATQSSLQAVTGDSLARSVLAGAGVTPIKTIPRHHIMVAMLTKA